VSVFDRYINKNNSNNDRSQQQAGSQRQQQATPQQQRQQSGQAASQSAPASSAAPVTGGRNVLSSDVEIKGKVKFSNDLIVDGKIEGEIISDGSLTVGENARLKAEIKTRSVVVHGKVHGNIHVTDRVELKKDAELVGDIVAATISIEPGAIFVGKSMVGTPTSKPEPNPKPNAEKPAEKPAASAKPTTNTAKKGQIAAAS